MEIILIDMNFKEKEMSKIGKNIIRMVLWNG